MRLKSPCVLFRSIGIETAEELEVAEKHFVVLKSRMSVTGGNLVIGRYSVLPFYQELEADVRSAGGALINSFREHRYVADLQNWVLDLGELTPKTWTSLQDVPDNVGPVILKGETNSRKNKWNTHMFARNKKEATEVFLRLNDDSLLSNQNIYVREFVPLCTLMIDPINEQPITEEYRFFVLDGKIMSSGYYWSSHVMELETIPNPKNVPAEFLNKVINKVKENIRFFVIDVAKTQSGEWIVIELNDGQQSGLSENDPKELYKNMKFELWDSKFQITH